MGHHVISVTPGVPSKIEDLAPEAEGERIKDKEITELADIEAKIVALQAKISATATRGATIDPVDVKAMADEIKKKREKEKNRKNFDTLRNKMTNLQDRIDRDNEATKISTAAGKSTPTPPPAPKTP